MIIGGFSGPERGANKKIPFQVSRLSPARAPIQAKRTIGAVSYTHLTLPTKRIV